MTGASGRRSLFGRKGPSYVAAVGAIHQPDELGDPEDFEDRVEEVQANEQVFGFMLSLHGLVHLVGFVLSWQIVEPAGFSYDDVWPDADTGPGRIVGVAWLLTAIGLTVVGIRLANRRDVARVELVVPLAASIVVCATASPQALPGLVISAVLLGSMLVLRARRGTQRT